MNLRLDKVSKSYVKASERLDILKSLSVDVKSGASLAVMGASGTGKSTLLNIMGGLDSPNSGHVYWDDFEITGKSDSLVAKKRLTCVGFIFQFHHLLKDFNADENVAMPLWMAGEKRVAAIKSAHSLLSSVGLYERRHHRPSELSGGEQQRVAICRALINRPNLLFADEPTGNLDPKSSENIFAQMLELVKEVGSTLVVVTHDKVLAEKTERAVFLNDGNMVESDMGASNFP